jgi:hypothetical protein
VLIGFVMTATFALLMKSADGDTFATHETATSLERAKRQAEATYRGSKALKCLKRRGGRS